MIINNFYVDVITSIYGWCQSQALICMFFRCAWFPLNYDFDYSFLFYKGLSRIPYINTTPLC